jgi:hypothetical protein
LTLVVAKEHESEPAPHVSMNGDPTEAQVQKQCAEIVVNDITLPVDVGTGGSMMGETMNTSPRKPADIGTGTTTATTETNPVKEAVYDNATPIVETSTTIDSTKLANMQKMLVTEDKPKIKPSEINVIKDPSVNLKTDDLKPDSVTMPSFSLSGLYPSLATKPDTNVAATKPAEAKVPDPKPLVDTTTSLDPKSPRKDIVDIQVGTNDLDETSSLANFFNDVKQIVEDKGIKVVAQTGSGVSLFEDASAAETTK